MVRTRAMALEGYSSRYEEPFRGLPPEIRRMMWSFALDDEITVRPLDCRCTCDILYLNPPAKTPDASPMHGSISHPRVLVWKSSLPRHFEMSGSTSLLYVSQTIREEAMELQRKIVWNISEMMQPCAMVRFMRLMPEAYYRFTRGLIISCQQLFMLTVEIEKEFQIDAFSSLRSPYCSRYPIDGRPIDLTVDITGAWSAYPGDNFILEWRIKWGLRYPSVPSWIKGLQSCIRWNVTDRCEFRYNDPSPKICTSMSEIARSFRFRVTQGQSPVGQIWDGKLSYVFDEHLRRASLFMQGKMIEEDLVT